MYGFNKNEGLLIRHRNDLNDWEQSIQNYHSNKTISIYYYIDHDEAKEFSDKYYDKVYVPYNPPKLTR